MHTSCHMETVTWSEPSFVHFKNGVINFICRKPSFVTLQILMYWINSTCRLLAVYKEYLHLKRNCTFQKYICRSFFLCSNKKSVKFIVKKKNIYIFKFFLKLLNCSFAEISDSRISSSLLHPCSLDTAVTSDLGRGDYCAKWHKFQSNWNLS